MKADRYPKMWLSRIACKSVSVITLIFFSAGTVFALPSGQQVVNGQATFVAQGNNLTITNSPNAIINWQGFSINSNEAVIFKQLNSLSAVLNRVMGQDPSRILGLLQSNGRVFLVNPNGIVIGQGARIDVNGFFASTLGIGNQDFLEGKYNFAAGEFAGSIQNQGTITTPAGGKVYLIAPEIENSGIITSPQGEVVLAAGHSVELVDSLDPNISVKVSAPEGKAVNLGQIIARSGRVGIYGGLIEQKGVVSADRAVVGENGRIFFKAAKDAILEEGSITSAKGGGKIEVFGDKENGRVAVNGTLDASAPDGGDGGFIETSAAKVTVGDQASVSTLAPYGKKGTWLIDPTNFTIGAEGDISGATLSAQLNSTNITIETGSAGGDAGDIIVDDPVTWSSANALMLRAHNNIQVNKAITLFGEGQLVLRADLDADGNGTVVFGGAVGAGGGSVYISPGLGGGATIYYNPVEGYTNPTDYSAFFPGDQPTAFMLVNNVNDLQNVNTNLAGHYALGKDIDASATSGWNNGAGFDPIGTFTEGQEFTGFFDGLGHTISNLFINRGGESFVGLFGSATDPVAAMIMNVGLVNVNITGGFQTGGLLGRSSGLVSNSYVTGTVHGLSNTVGGLIGLNAGTVMNSYSTASVQGGTFVGGLIGSLYSATGSPGGAAVINSYSTGSVTGNSSVGGLLGDNTNNGLAPNVISNSFWDTQTSGQTTSAGGTGKTTAEMQTQATYTGWDFTNTWQIVGTSYPTLRFQTTAPPPAQQQTISGVLNAGAGKTIFFAVNGSLLPDTATTGTGGIFSVALELDTVPTGSALLAYVGNDTVKSAYVFLSAGGNITNLLLESSTVTAGSAAGAISNSTLNSAKGGLTSTDIPYTVFPTNLALSLNSGIHFKTAAAYTINGNITTTNANQTFNGPVTLNAPTVTLSAGLGNIHFGGAVLGGTNTLVLNTQGAVTQAASITVGGLGLLGAGGTFILTNPGNTVQTLAADTGTIQFTNSASLGLGTVGNTAGITASGDLTVTAGGPISQTAPVKVTGAAIFNAGTNSITLTDAANDFTSVSVTGGTVLLQDATSVALHASTIGSDIDVVAGGDILLGGLINAGAGTVTLSAAGAIVNNMGGATSILADTLNASANSGIGSSDPLMTAVHNLNATNFAVNNIEIGNTGVLAVGTLVNNASTGNIALQNIGAVTTDTSTILSAGTVTIIAHSPLTIGPGGVEAFDTVTLEASPSGGADNLTINGDITSAFGDINLTAGSSIVVSPESALNAPNGTITMTEGLNGTQTGNLEITGNEEATNSTVSSLMTAMGRITSEENGDDDDERKKKSQEGRQQSGDDGKTDEGKNYCN